ncbi:RagB/SusD family nutrient uptake outer membrane protein [Sphingobacterium sp. DR205]|uniref:RagB/SusD family nutrient uptake outer membrane protein n=1 Tax=Sphingobacterium sp. DR205 TaxID=2713573 RepID=UPI0013E504DC|nr:RagB/SusD family nutrient uptake outer membrane protein [Sphingobacterium sp. DR205]QIH31453.1 RagB/SusD family nutrient uptake outer membrane protein [Sphingobacterium sp. DR205]
MKKLIYLIVLCLFSCNDFLDEKADISWKEPKTLDDLQALLNDENNINGFLPSLGDIASDYYYLSEQNFNSRSENARLLYSWNQAALTDNTWTFSMSQIFYFNLVLDNIYKVSLGSMSENDRKRIKGSAAFLRAMTYFQLATIYSPQFKKGINDNEMTIPIKKTPDIGEAIVFSRLGELYDFIETDLRTAVELLPEKQEISTRPTRLAAKTLFSRFYLSLGNWERASFYAGEAMKGNVVLLNFKDLPINSQQPFERFNGETLFYSTISGNESIFAPSIANVPQDLFDLYGDGDLRKTAFFTVSGAKITFKGSYTGMNNSTLFGGVTSGELYLNYAESLIRSDRINEGLDVLNTLLKNRYAENSFLLYSGLSRAAAIDLLKRERLKELCFKGGIRWMDLKRYAALNSEPLVITRRIGDKNYQLDLSKNETPFKIPIGVGK